MVRVVGLGFVLAIVLGVVSMFGGNRVLAAATTITIISGDIQVRHGAGSFAPANDGEVLTAGDTIRTGDSARAVLTYFEGSTVSLEPNTELTIEDVSTLTDGSTVVVMQQSLGRSWHVVTKLITGGSKYEVRTPASTASVRGTTFTVDVEFEDALPVATVTTTEGTVVHSAPDPAAPSRQVSVLVTAGTTERIKRGEKPTPAAPAAEPKVTVEVEVGNSLIVDALGRINGYDRDGKRVIQTPGAQVKKVGDRVVIELPDRPDAKPAKRVDPADDNERGKTGNAGPTVDGRGNDPAPKVADEKRVADAPKSAGKTQAPPKAPRLLPKPPAAPKAGDNKRSGNTDSRVERKDPSKSNGSDAATKDKEQQRSSAGE